MAHSASVLPLGGVEMVTEVTPVQVESKVAFASFDTTGKVWTTGVGGTPAVVVPVIVACALPEENLRAGRLLVGKHGT